MIEGISKSSPAIMNDDKILCWWIFKNDTSLNVSK